MKKIKKFQWLMMAVCLFVVGNVSVMAEGEGETQPRPVPIPLVNEDFIQGGDYRTDTALHVKPGMFHPDKQIRPARSVRPPDSSTEVCYLQFPPSHRSDMYPGSLR